MRGARLHPEYDRIRWASVPIGGMSRIGLGDVASEMEIEDGVIWVYGVGEDGVLAFTDFGIESLIELIKMYKDDPTLLKRCDPQ